MRRFNYLFVLISTFLVAALFSLMPLPFWLAWLKPIGLILVFLYWILSPYPIGLGFIWGLGLLTDILHGSLMGTHALAFLLVAYWVLRFRLQIIYFFRIQQAFIIFLLLIFYEMLFYGIIRALNQPTSLPNFSVISCILGALCWPFLCWGLTKYRCFFRL